MTCLPGGRFGAGRPAANERAVANRDALPLTVGRTLIGPRATATDFFGLGQNARLDGWPLVRPSRTATRPTGTLSAPMSGRPRGRRWVTPIACATQGTSRKSCRPRPGYWTEP